MPGDLPLINVKIQADEDYAGVTLTGLKVGDAFAVTPQLSRADGFSGNWHVTHVPTGRTLGDRATCIRCAERIARIALNAPVDWALPIADLAKVQAARAVHRLADSLSFECSNNRTCSARVDAAQLSIEVPDA